jgi:hypothetical protein
MHEVLARIEDGLALGAGQHTHADALGNTLDVAPRVLRNRRFVGGGIEAEDEHLRLVDVGAFIRQGFEDGGTAGAELVRGRAFERRAGRRRQAGLEAEATAQPGGQVAVEVVDPVLRIGPASAAGCGAIDVEGFGQSRIAEGDHGLGEAHRNLAHALDLALRGKHLDLGRARRRGKQQPAQGPPA